MTFECVEITWFWRNQHNIHIVLWYQVKNVIFTVTLWYLTYCFIFIQFNNSMYRIWSLPYITLWYLTYYTWYSCINIILNIKYDLDCIKLHDLLQFTLYVYNYSQYHIICIIYTEKCLWHLTYYTIYLYFIIIYFIYNMILTA